MDDLRDLQWENSQSKTGPNGNKLTLNALKPLRPLSPVPSGRITPLSAQSSGSQVFPSSSQPTKAATGKNDSFASLLSSRPRTPAEGAGTSLRERQKQLDEEKARKQAEEQQLFDARFNSSGARGNNGISAPPSRFASASPAPESEQDILAAFNADAPVDASSHFPAPPRTGSTPISRATPEPMTRPLNGAGMSGSDLGAFNDDDDDPFGLSANKSGNNAAASSAQNTGAIDDDDDILGDLSKPVSDVRRPTPPKPKSPVKTAKKPASAVSGPLAELIDMGFPREDARAALSMTPDGKDLQAAIGILLDKAHKKTGSTRPGGAPPGASRAEPSRGDRATPRSDDVLAQDKANSNWENDVAHMASNLGSSLFKSANSLWKTGQRQVQKAVADMQNEGEQGQPKWMRDSNRGRPVEEELSGSRPKPRAEHSPSVTDEAMMLDSHNRPARKEASSSSKAAAPTRQRDPVLPSRQDVDPRKAPRPAQQNGFRDAPARTSSPLSAAPSRRTQLTREDIDQESSQAYVSPARRKKTPVPDVQQRPPPQKAPAPSSASPGLAARPSSSQRASPAPPRASPVVKPKPKAPPRTIPSVPSFQLQQCLEHRTKGGEEFKRGDYTAAHESYTQSLLQLPNTHPIAIIVLCNRSLTSLKLGNAKAAVEDAHQAITIIGVGKGEDETIQDEPNVPPKPMRGFWGKAMSRKAEGLEHQEKWREAGVIWRECVEAGVGLPTSIQARDRCERAANPDASAASSGRSTPASKPNTPRPGSARPAAARRPAAPVKPVVVSQEAVAKLREANAAAERADDEKFALSDHVDARLTAWKAGKADNLRALLGSLDTVLWPESGWKKVGLNELVMTNKVKIVYMKAIAKVHPDKIAQDATTEQRMISASVFSTLNEAWDKFKKDNGL